MCCRPEGRDGTEKCWLNRVHSAGALFLVQHRNSYHRRGSLIGRIGLLTKDGVHCIDFRLSMSRSSANVLIHPDLYP